MITRTFVALISTGFVLSANAFVSWSVPSGSGTGFNYLNGGSDNGLFGDPAAPVTTTFSFAPQGFTAPDNGNDTVSDRIQVQLQGVFDTITVIESGTYSIVGGGQVSAQATHFGLISPIPIIPDEEQVTFTTTGDESGTWQLTTEITVPTGVVNFIMILENRLQSTGANASITKDNVQIIIPEPSSLALLAALSLLIRRR